MEPRTQHCSHAPKMQFSPVQLGGVGGGGLLLWGAVLPARLCTLLQVHGVNWKAPEPPRTWGESEGKGMAKRERRLPEEGVL